MFIPRCFFILCIYASFLNKFGESFYRILHKHGTSSIKLQQLYARRSGPKRPVELPQFGEDIAFFYLQQELKVDENTLVNIIRKHSWILYLKVDSNLRPTVEVLNSFGFRNKDIRDLVDSIPSILAIDHKWTLPEKLVSIQKMFYLSKQNLVRLVVNQPLLLTSSIDRNLEIANFFLEDLALTPDQLRTLVLKYPQVINIISTI